MTKSDNEYDDGNEDRNNDNNAASGSGSNVPIFDPITTPRSPGVILGDNRNGAAAAAHFIYTCHNIYIT